ncbi:MAG: ATP-binding protein [Bacteroidales bacterium]|nr:ATP-binding protein [Bacteroidales bacterium]
MNFSNSRHISLFTSITTTSVAVMLYTITAIIFYEFDPLVLLVYIGIIFPFTYFILNYLLEKFIWGKIKLIYKTIHSFKKPKNGIKRSGYIDKNIIENVNKEVLEWEEDNLKEIDKLKRMEAYRREFIGNVSHELKTPIFNIQGYVLTLMNGGLEDETVNRSYLERTEKNIDRMIAIVNDLDAIAKLETGELKMKLVKFDIVALVKEVFDFLEIKAHDNKITLYFGAKYENPIYVLADKENIKQVIINLLNNSMKYGLENGKTKVRFFDMDENILVEVTDNGIGIEPHEIPRVFERFYRTEKARSLQKKGSGLGLSIVKHIIDAHNETINVRSTIGVGTTFAFTLKKAPHH